MDNFSCGPSDIMTGRTLPSAVTTINDNAAKKFRVSQTVNI